MHVKPKKRLGQNFLTDRNIQNKILRSCAIQPSDLILEIGPGRGELTSLIAKEAKRLYAVELDKDLYQYLKALFSSQGNVKLINKDILDFDINKYFKRSSSKIKVIGNIPYYISSPILEKLINSRGKISRIFLTVQKEFADRLVARPGSSNFSSFACFIQYYLEPEIIFSIKKNSFYPAPKVDSSFLSLLVREEPAVKVKDEGVFFKLIRSSFNKRRKTLRNSLRDIVPLEKLERFFREYSINKNTRPQELTLQNFADLANL
ncbi:MAG TPA: 16S rRNA (adenine(1518)-N(6)/adenine(1519)-N(6))-dimethyltransferase RsmA [Candidatus Margulisiibacteriota bacterium]|nr:16S rRNA (adenine(1518)-N(6)/adenine(1519)-N(6))-dimethyltransferase RsmA [Candidatus Margulisiibacteriota bacterium]